jgi:hypothetical protein
MQKAGHRWPPEKWKFQRFLSKSLAWVEAGAIVDVVVALLMLYSRLNLRFGNRIHLHSHSYSRPKYRILGSAFHTMLRLTVPQSPIYPFLVS